MRHIKKIATKPCLVALMAVALIYFMQTTSADAAHQDRFNHLHWNHHGTQLKWQ